MPSIEILITFFVATFVFAYMPGPAMLYAAAQTIARGRRSGWMAALGIHIGGYAHVVAAAAGLALLFEIVPPLYIALKLIGAAYLIWLGLRLFLAKETAATSSPKPRQSPRVGPSGRASLLKSLTQDRHFLCRVSAPVHRRCCRFPGVAATACSGHAGQRFVFDSGRSLRITGDRVTKLLRASRSANRLAGALAAAC